MDQLSLSPRLTNKTPLQTLEAMKASTKAAPDDTRNSKARKTAEEFESSFLSAMLEQMFTGLEAEAPFGGGHAETTYRSLLVGEYAKSISQSGGIGIADQVYRQLLSVQEGHG